MIFPPSEEQMATVQQILRERDTPYIIVKDIASPEVWARVKAEAAKFEGSSFCVDWAPQKRILGHPASSIILINDGLR